MVRARLPPVWGVAACDPAFTEAFGRGHAELSGALDDYTRANGPTDEMLTELAPAAVGQYVLVLTLAGRPPPPNKMESLASQEAKKGSHQLRSRPDSRQDRMDLSASVFSVAQRKSVAMVAVEYAGLSSDEALSLFANKLTRMLPHAHCGGWNWSALDPARVAQALSP